MKGETSSIIKVVSVYVGAVVGAGFASGQEIIHFFTRYGKESCYGVILTGVLFSLLGCIILDKVYLERIRSFEELVFPLAGLFLGRLIQIVSAVFLLSVYCVMIAGLGTIISIFFKLPLEYGVILASFICMIIMLVGVEGIAKVNVVLVPVLVVGVIATGIFIMSVIPGSPVARRGDAYAEAFNGLYIETFNLAGYIKSITGNWIFSSILYVSYNNIIAMAVLSSLLPYLKTRRTAIAGGILGGLLICFTAMILNICLLPFHPWNTAGEFPVATILERYSSFLTNMYNAVMLSAMLTSAVTSGYGAICGISARFKLNLKLATIAVSALSVPLACIGFSRLISSVYPLFGYVGMFMLLLLILNWVTRLCSKSSLPKKRPGSSI
ncbi:MAG: hypothetical protein GX754_09460 [Clostridiaceae bacterium]|nr:hypothetical protein [Clostridiaceae bacterium]